MTQTTILLIMGIVCFAAFSWAIKGHFRSLGKMPRGMKRVTALNVAAFGWFVWRLVTEGAAAIWPLAFLLFLLSFTIFCWAVYTTRRARPTLAFSDDQPSVLFRDGPYHYVRHPFYLAYLTFWIATAAATPCIVCWGLPLVMLLVYRLAAIIEERKFAASTLASAYAAYKANVGMFLPRPSALLPD